MKISWKVNAGLFMAAAVLMLLEATIAFVASDLLGGALLLPHRGGGEIDRNTELPEGETFAFRFFML